jgi:hypothetical protein
VRSSTKLAYTAPVLAATYTLFAGSALAQQTCRNNARFDPDGPNGPGCYSCAGRPVDGTRCYSARFYNPTTGRCENRRGRPGGANCQPSYSLPITP